MKVAVITPYHGETTDQLRRCHDSVLAQTHPTTRHIMVADGDPHPWCRQQDLDHMIMPCHSDAGATPRALGALSAFARGYDAVAFLDADNWYDDSHISCMIETVGDAAGVIATRRIHGLDGQVMYTDTWESNGVDHVDTNCWFLTRQAMHLMSHWIVEQGQRLWSDRRFWDAVKKSDLKLVKQVTPTVAYVTKWAAHYINAGKEPPPESVWISKDSRGNLIHLKHKDRS